MSAARQRNFDAGPDVMVFSAATMSTTTIKNFSKVPEVALGFWFIKVLATTLGEVGGDSHSSICVRFP